MGRGKMFCDIIQIFNPNDIKSIVYNNILTLCKSAYPSEQNIVNNYVDKIVMNCL